MMTLTDSELQMPALSLTYPCPHLTLLKCLKNLFEKGKFGKQKKPNIDGDTYDTRT